MKLVIVFGLSIFEEHIKLAKKQNLHGNKCTLIINSNHWHFSYNLCAQIKFKLFNFNCKERKKVADRKLNWLRFISAAEIQKKQGNEFFAYPVIGQSVKSVLKS